MDSLMKRAAAALAFFVVGVNLVGFGMTVNGYDHPRNPTWQFFAGVFDLEKTVLEIIAWGIGGVAVFWLIQRAITAWNEPQCYNVDRAQEPWPEIKPHSVPVFQSQPRPAYVPTAHVPMAQPEPKPVPKPRVLSAEEVKQKAIQEILGRW